MLLQHLKMFDELKVFRQNFHFFPVLNHVKMSGVVVQHHLVVTVNDFTLTVSYSLF